jgi:hypothetical protein
MTNPANDFAAVLNSCRTILQQTIIEANAAAKSAAEAEEVRAIVAGLAPIDSPHFTGIPTAVTADRMTATTQLATTEYLDRLIAQPLGLATLDASGLIPVAQLPPLALTQVYVVNSQAEMLALSASVGDMAVRTDTNETFILSALPPSTLGNWTQLLFSAPVVSVAGLTGTISGSALNAALAAFTGDSGAGGVKGLVPAPAAGDAAAGKVLGAGGGYVVKAGLVSPVFSGAPTVPTAMADDNTGVIANTSWVLGQGGAATPIMDGSASAGTSTRWSRQDHVHPTDTSRAPLSSPSFTGVPAAPTPSPGDNTTKLATTAFVTAAIVASVAGVTSFNGRTGTVVPASGDYAVAEVTGAAPISSPAFTGNPTAATQSPGNNSTRLATTAYADAAAGQAAIPTGTTMLFRQTSAPTGWTKIMTYNDVGIRIVSGSVGQDTSKSAFSTVFSQTATGNVNLTASQQANMGVTGTFSGGALSVGGSFSGTGTGKANLVDGAAFHDNSAVFFTDQSPNNSGFNISFDISGLDVNVNVSGAITGSTSAQGGTISGTAAGGGTTGSAHAHSVALQLNYVDVILASKN